MRTIRAIGGPLSQRPFYEEREVERLCAEELMAVGLYPSAPEPVRIERFIGKRFGVRVVYEEVPPGVLGYTRFGRNGVEAVVVSRDLAEDGSAVAERRLNTTLAHEAGHGLLHGHLFVLEESAESLFGADGEAGRGKIMCRDDSVAHQGRPAARRYDGRWWEVQANMAIGPLLLPRRLAEKALDGLLDASSAIGVTNLAPGAREEAIRRLATTFEVNAAVAHIRLEVMYPAAGVQLTL